MARWLLPAALCLLLAPAAIAPGVDDTRIGAGQGIYSHEFYFVGKRTCSVLFEVSADETAGGTTVLRIAAAPYPVLGSGVPPPCGFAATTPFMPFRYDMPCSAPGATCTGTIATGIRATRDTGFGESFELTVGAPGPSTPVSFTRWQFETIEKVTGSINW